MTTTTATTLESYRAVILGGIWWPMGATCSLEQEFTAESDEYALDRAHMAGDFSEITDVQLWRRDVCDHGRSGWVLVKDWSSEENELAYLDTISSDDDM
jgi:hypothetical protein